MAIKNKSKKKNKKKIVAKKGQVQAFTYKRFSSTKQMGNSSIDRQSETLKSWLFAHPNVVVMDEFIDEAISGWTGKHIKDGSLGILLEAIGEGLIPKGSLILVEHFSRLSRMDQDRTLDLIRQIWDADISIITVGDGAVYAPKDRNKLEKRIRLVLEIDKAYSDSLWRSEKVKASYVRREKLADEEGKTPALRRPFWLDKSGKLNKYAIVVKDMFELYLSGLGQMLILKTLKEKYPTFRPVQKMNATTIIRWVTSENTIGKWRGYKVYEAVVDESVFLDAKLVHKERLYDNVKADRKWPLSGLVRCGHCDAGMSIQQSKDSLPVLRCSKRQRTGKSECMTAKENTTFPYAVAHQYFFHRVHKLALKKLSSRNFMKDSYLDLKKIDYELEKKEIKFREEKSVYEELTGAGKPGKVVLMLMSDTDEEITSLKERKKALEVEIAKHEGLSISNEAIELIDDPIAFNLTMHQLKIRLIIKNRKLYYENDLGYQYSGYNRKTKKYACFDLTTNKKVHILVPPSPEFFLLNAILPTAKQTNEKRIRREKLKKDNPEEYKKEIAGIVANFQKALKK